MANYWTKEIRSLFRYLSVSRFSINSVKVFDFSWTSELIKTFSEQHGEYHTCRSGKRYPENGVVGVVGK